MRHGVDAVDQRPAVPYLIRTSRTTASDGDSRRALASDPVGVPTSTDSTALVGS